uniref:Secreted protein n=1 Tax=Zea mays TaxID=4577 RepID=C4J4K5_MAIZE|nr:unknown [Zea mays]
MMGASDRARTETRAFLMLASCCCASCLAVVDGSAGSGLSPRSAACCCWSCRLPADDDGRGLPTSVDEFDVSSAAAAGPRPRNCLGDGMTAAASVTGSVWATAGGIIGWPSARACMSATRCIWSAW